MKLPAFGIVVTLKGEGGTIEPGELVAGADEPECRAAYDAILSMVLAHAIAGIDVRKPEYIQGIKDAVQAIDNQY